MKIELLVTMKTGEGTLWPKGMIFSSPLPQDIMVELRDRPWTVKILEMDPPPPPEEKKEVPKKIVKRNL